MTWGGHTFIGTISNYNEGANVTVSNGTIDGYVFPYGAESFTLSDITGEEIGIQPTDSTLNIESGTYTSTSNDSVIYTGTNSTINITGGTFETTGVMIPVIQANNWGDTGEVTLNISGGTFTATNGMAVDFSNENDPMYHITPGIVNANISGGTFSGANAALSIIDPTLNNIQLSGGTYSFTDTSDNTNAAIVSWDGNPDSITGLLADGYHFTNGDVTTVETDWGTTIAVLGDTEVVADGSEDANKGGVKSPDTGVFTAESGSASVADGALVMLIAAAALGLLGYKKFARK